MLGAWDWPFFVSLMEKWPIPCLNGLGFCRGCHHRPLGDGLICQRLLSSLDGGMGLAIFLGFLGGKMANSMPPGVRLCRGCRSAPFTMVFHLFWFHLHRVGHGVGHSFASFLWEWPAPCLRG